MLNIPEHLCMQRAIWVPPVKLKRVWEQIFNLVFSFKYIFYFALPCYIGIPCMMESKNVS